MVKHSLKRVYFIPNAITAFALACGLFVIFKTSVADPSKDLFSLLQASAILLLIAALADFADGAVARLIKAESEFGGYFDSLSDAVTFGVAPPLLILKSLYGADLSPFLIFFLIVTSMLYSLCGVLRLVRYNVKSREKKESNDSGTHFTGLPIPASASCALSAALILISPNVSFPFGAETRAWILGGILVVLGYFMISRWKFPSVKALHFRIPSIYLVFATGIIAVIALYGILDYFPEAYFTISWLYFAISWILSLIRLLLGKRSKTLVDFDPDDED